MSLVANPTHGTIALDQYNQQYKYNKYLNCWILSGTSISYEQVTLYRDGLATPTIITLLEQFEASKYSEVKLWPQSNAYWYLVQSRQQTIELTAQDNRLQLEIAANYLTRLLLSRTNACRGPQGKRGQQGESGTAGLPGPIEKEWPVTPGKVLSIRTQVEAPLDTPISLRLLQNRQIVIEILVGSDGTTITYSNGFNRVLDQPQVSYDRNSKILSADLQFQDGLDFGPLWSYRARQQGPSGYPGADGDPFLQVREQTVGDPAIRYNRAVRVMRANPRDDLFHISAEFNDGINLCMHLRTNFEFGDALALTSTTKPRPSTLAECCKSLEEETPDFWAALEPTIDSGKAIHKWGLDREKYNPTDLNTPIWEPNEEPSQSVFVPFNWFAQQDLPFTISTSPRPEHSSTAEDLFLCNNLGEPCDICPTVQEGNLEQDIGDLG
jgi:hypothetical protein